MNQRTDIPYSFRSLSTRVALTLLRNGYSTPDAVLNMTFNDLLSLRGGGPGAAMEVFLYAQRQQRNQRVRK